MLNHNLAVGEIMDQDELLIVIEKTLEEGETQLDLSGNQLSELPPEIVQLTNLTQLDLSGNQLSELPPEISNLNDSISLSLEDNPIEKPPPEVVEQGIAAIRDYFRQLEAEGVDYLYQAKLLIIGEAGAGKTTLMKKIKNPDYELKHDEKSTEGIEVGKWDFNIDGGQTFRLNIWDFGGQEIYHATHQFFLTKRSLYILVADTRKEDTDFYKWLNLVELLSGNSPLLIIKNEKQDRHREINERQLRGRFSNLKETLATNLATNRGLDKVLAAIKYFANELPHIGSPLPKTWVLVRSELENDARNHIKLEEYLDICLKNGFERRADALQLSEYLNDLGVCLHFQGDPLLKSTVILKPEWGTEAVYKVLDNHKVIQNLGRFTCDDLGVIWYEDKYSGMRDELLQLMMRFQLCYEIPGSAGHYIAPQLLTENQPAYDWEETNNLLLRYTYEFMPDGILTRFIVMMQQWIADQECVWKNGVVLENNETWAEVIEYKDRREIRIRVSGRYKRDLITVVMHELDKIHNSFHRLKIDKLIPCNCSRCKNSQMPYFYRFENLKRRIVKRRYEVECENSFEMVDVWGLLDDVKIEKEDLEDDIKGKGQIYIDKAVLTRSERSTIIMEQKKEKVIEIGKGAKISAPVVIADSIENSFNTLAESDVEGDVKKLLEDLLETIAKVNQEVPKEQEDAAEEMARDAETLVKEATSSKPRRKWYEVSIDGLEQAAINIGRVAKPVLEIVRHLRKALLSI